MVDSHYISGFRATHYSPGVFMKKLLWYTPVAIVLTVAALISVTFAQSDNLLTNPGYEEPYTDEGGNPSRQVANGWDAWNVQRTADEPDFQNTQPEYSEADRADRVRSGGNAQQFESFFATHTGGVFQVVPSVGAGNEVTFGVYVWVWSSSLDDEDVSENDGDVIIDVGIDPTGGTDGTSGDIIWSVGQEQYDAYNLYTVSAITEADTISVWVRSRVGFPVKTSRIYLDDSFLTVEGDGPATDEPTETEEATDETVEPATTVAPSPTPDTVEEITPSPVTPTTPPISDEFPDTITHVVQRGDTVSALATRYSSSVTAIQQANGLNTSSLIFVGQSLVVPVPAGTNITATPTPTSVVIVITATPSTNVTAIPPTSVPTQVVGNTYIVQPGDTLTSIARRFNTTAAALAQLNGIVNQNRIFTGQTLVVPTGAVVPTPIPVITATPISAVTAIPVITTTPIPAVTAVPVITATPIPQGPRIYVVQPGDNLFRVSLLFNVSVSDLIRANGIVNANRIFTGQQLIIP